MGAASAASFYAPIEKVKEWSWETTWAVAGFFSWILLPIGVSLALLPHFDCLLLSIPSPFCLKVALLGAMWGIGNVSYGLTMRHLGISMGVGVAIGVTLVVGTLIPPLLHGQARDALFNHDRPAHHGRRLVALVGVAIVSFAGHRERSSTARRVKEFNVSLGLSLAVMCGIFSSGIRSQSMPPGPWRRGAATRSQPALRALPSYVLIMGGGALVNMTYCFIRLAALKRLSLRADLAQRASTLLKNGGLAAAGGSCGISSSSSTHGAKPTSRASPTSTGCCT